MMGNSRGKCIFYNTDARFMARLSVDGSKQDMTFSACHIIQGHSKCGRMHGHNYSVSVSLEGELDKGLIMDFGPLKKAVRNICKEIDHRVLLPKYLVKIEGEQVNMDVDGKHYSFPFSDVVLLPLEVVSTELLAKWFLDRLVKDVEIPSGVARIGVRVDESEGQGAWAEQDL